MTPQDFSRYIESFITALSHKKSEHTQLAYKRDLGQFIAFWQSHAEPVELQKLVERFLASLAHDGVTASSIARKISCFNSFKKYLKKLGVDIHLELKRPAIPPQDPLFLPVKDVFNLLDIVGIGDLATQFPYRDKALLELIYSTGITCSEVVNVEIKNVDFHERSVIIRSKRKKERVVLFGEQATVCIKAYLEKERPAVKSTNEPLFLNHRNNPLTPRSVQRICALFRGALENKKEVTPPCYARLSRHIC